MLKSEAVTWWGAPARVIENSQEEKGLDRTRELDRFLASVERSAFRIARFAVRDTDEALDIVQDAMIQLVKSYAHKPSEEWKPLFYRILENKIRDFQRKASVRNRVMAWFGSSTDDDHSESLIDRSPDTRDPQPDGQAALDDAVSALDRAVYALPARQQQAFLLRHLEGLDVAQTAKAMGCSQGSVKTHYSRAVHRLREELGEHWS